MKFSYLYFLMFSVLLLSCNKDDEQLPLSLLDGTYEQASENTDTNIWYVNQYVFKLDGTYETFQFLRDTEDGPNFGVTYFSRGTYTPRGEEFSVSRSESYSLDYEKFPVGYAASVEDLDEQELTLFADSKGTLTKLNGGNKISILFECNDMLSENFTLLMCIGAQEYVKVD
jgi:hypothetical protein